MAARHRKAKREARLAQLADYSMASRKRYWDEVHRVEREIADRSPAAEAERERRAAMHAPGSDLHRWWTTMEQACRNGRPIMWSSIDDPFAGVWPTPAGARRPRNDCRWGG
jgi:hypothetical protein